MGKDRTLVFIASLAFIMAFVWAVFGAINSSRKSTIPEDIVRIMEPLNPYFDEGLIGRIAQRGKMAFK